MPAQSENPQCPFCQLIANPEQTFTVHETENFKAWLDINPRARGHTMIVPKEHLTSMEEIGENISELFEISRIVMEKAKNGLDADGVSLVLNEGEAGGQNLDHFYVQVFPRFEDEENAGAPAGAVFQPLEDMDESDLEDISSQMEAADFPEFDASKGGAGSKIISANRGEAVEDNNEQEQRDTSGEGKDHREAETGTDSGEPSREEEKKARQTWDGEEYSWNADGAEFK